MLHPEPVISEISESLAKVSPRERFLKPSLRETRRVAFDMKCQRGKEKNLDSHYSPNRCNLEA